MKGLKLLGILLIITVLLYQITDIYKLLIPTEVLIGIIIIEIFIIAVETNSNYLRYKKPRIIWKIIEKYTNFIIRRQIREYTMLEDKQEYRRQLALIALENVKSTDLEKKIAGLAQLYAMSEDAGNIINEEIYQCLIVCVGNEPDKTFREAIIDAICYFRKSRLYQRETTQEVMKSGKFIKR